MAGNYKKANNKESCIKASKDAYELIKLLSGERDQQSCRCLFNLAQVYSHFEQADDAKACYTVFTELYKAQNGEGGT